MIAIISDIHANLEALQTVLSHIDGLGIHPIYCLGDVVGYGPRPNECVDLVQQRCQFTLMGNHDFAAIGKADIAYFNRYAQEAILWTINRLTPERKAFLESLPFTRVEEPVLYAHSTPINPEEWNYILSEREALYYLDRVSQRVIFIGHSHIPVVFSEKEQPFYQEEPFRLDLENNRYVINVGSVGQPRDGDPRACLVLFDPDQATVQYVRLHYNVEKTAQEILDAKLPAFLALRLKSGH
ncbi:MAG: metallophosphoesterase [Calditrichaeota bacterium]|nr:MAG: metallophosphoesterase [Calditrichota bacterium]